MRVVIVSQHFPPEVSGNASRVSDMAEKLAAAGVETTVLAPHPSFPPGSFPRRWKLRGRARRGGVEVVNLWTWQPRAKDPGFLSRVAYYLTFSLHASLWALLNARRYEVIVCSTPPLFAAVPGFLVRTLMRRKLLVVEVRDLWIDAAVGLGFVRERGLSTRLARALERRCLLRADLVAVTTEDVAAKLSARHPLPRPPVVVPNGVDTARFRPAPASKKPQFLYAGNLGHAQDLETVVRAMAIVRRSHPQARLVLVGDGDVAEALRKVAREEGLEDVVRFIGVLPRDEVVKLYAESVAGLAPLRKLATLEYAVPTKAYEAMACGVPFIGTGLGEIARLARESGGGAIAESTPEGVADAMLRLLDAPDEAERMGRRGREHVVARYDRGAVAARYLDAIREVMRDRR